MVESTIERCREIAITRFHLRCQRHALGTAGQRLPRDEAALQRRPASLRRLCACGERVRPSLQPNPPTARLVGCSGWPVLTPLVMSVCPLPALFRFLAVERPPAKIAHAAKRLSECHASREMHHTPRRPRRWLHQRGLWGGSVWVRTCRAGRSQRYAARTCTARSHRLTRHVRPAWESRCERAGKRAGGGSSGDRRRARPQRSGAGMDTRGENGHAARGCGLVWTHGILTSVSRRCSAHSWHGKSWPTMCMSCTATFQRHTSQGASSAAPRGSCQGVWAARRLARARVWEIVPGSRPDAARPLSCRRRGSWSQQRA